MLRVLCRNVKRTINPGKEYLNLTTKITDFSSWHGLAITCLYIAGMLSDIIQIPAMEEHIMTEGDFKEGHNEGMKGGQMERIY